MRRGRGDAGAHGARRDAQHLADLGVVHADEVAERDRGPVFGRQVRERGLDVEAVGDTGFGGRAVGPARFRAAFGGQRPSAAPARLVERGVRRDAVRPRGELRPAVERPDLARDREQRFLGGVERVVGVAEDPPAHAVNQRGVVAQQRVERPTVTVGRPSRPEPRRERRPPPTRVTPADRSRRFP